MNRIIKHTQYHYSITGKYRVNFHPSKKTFYINGCNKGVVKSIRILNF